MEKYDYYIMFPITEIKKNELEVTDIQPQGSNDKGKSIAMSTLLMVYAPINRFHILDINQGKA